MTNPYDLAEAAVTPAGQIIAAVHSCDPARVRAVVDRVIAGRLDPLPATAVQELRALLIALAAMADPKVTIEARIAWTVALPEPDRDEVPA